MTLRLISALILIISLMFSQKTLASDCDAQDLRSYFSDTPRDTAIDIGDSLAYTFEHRELECLETLKNGINPTHRDSAEAGTSYVQLHFKLINFEDGVDPALLRVSLGKFLRRFLFRKNMVNTLDILVHAGDTQIGQENIISVSYDDMTKHADYSAVAFIEGPLTPWVPASETNTLRITIKGHALNQPNFHGVTSLLNGAKLAAGLQTSPTRVLSNLTQPHFVAGAKAINEKLDIVAEMEISPVIEVRALGGSRDTAGMYFELIDIPEACVERPGTRACRRAMPQGPVQPKGGVIIYPVYQNSLMAAPEQVIEGTDFPDIKIEASKIRRLPLGPLGAEGRPHLYEFLQIERPGLFEAMTSRDTSLQQFEQQCNNLADFIAGETGLQLYDRAAMMWAFLQVAKAYSKIEVQTNSTCPEIRTVERIRELELEHADLGSPITAADVEIALKVVEDAIFDLSSPRGTQAERQRRAFDRFDDSIERIKVTDRTGLIANGGIRDPEDVSLRFAVAQFLDPIAKRFPQTCSSSLSEITAAAGETIQSDRLVGYILLSSGNLDTTAEFAEMVVEFEGTTRQAPLVSIAPQSLENVFGLRDMYPGCSEENFPLPGDGDVETDVTSTADGEEGTL